MQANESCGVGWLLLYFVLYCRFEDEDDVFFLLRPGARRSAVGAGVDSEIAHTSSHEAPVRLLRDNIKQYTNCIIIFCSERTAFFFFVYSIHEEEPMMISIPYRGIHKIGGCSGVVAAHKTHIRNMVVTRRAFGGKNVTRYDHDDCFGEEDTDKIAEAIFKVRDRFSISRNQDETDRINMVADLVSTMRTLSKKEIKYVRSKMDITCSSENDNGKEDDKDE